MANSSKTSTRLSAQREVQPRASSRETAHSEALTQATQLMSDVAGNVARAQNAAGAAAGPDLVTELNAIDFAKLIGGPLQAAVQAQVASSLASIDFIKNIGFTKPVDPQDTPKLVMADFSYSRTVAGNPDESETIDLKVPLISVVSIPSLRLETVDINFNVKLDSVETQDVSEKIGIDASVGAQIGPVNFKVTASYQRGSTSGVKVEKEYTMNVKVHASQDELPKGLEMVLGKLTGG